MAAAIGIAKTATEIFLGVGTVSVDNLTFQLHYRWSVTLFIVCSVLVQTSQFFGDPVQCETVSKKNIQCVPFKKLQKQKVVAMKRCIDFMLVKPNCV